MSIATTSRGGWLLGALSLSDNTCDGHALGQQLSQVRRFVWGKIETVPEAYVDLGNRGYNYTGPETAHIDKRRRGTTPKSLWRWMKRRAAVEPTIGHMKSKHRLERNRLKGTIGDAINALRSAAAMNFQTLLGFFLYFWLRLCAPFWLPPAISISLVID